MHEYFESYENPLLFKIGASYVLHEAGCNVSIIVIVLLPVL